MGDRETLAAKRLRMLRMGASLTAEALAWDCAREGISTLDRGTIAKIESHRRQITAAEVEGVARIFGLTSADLLDPVGPAVLVCYAQQDDVVGREVSAWLADHGFLVMPDMAGFADRGARDLPGDVDVARAFVALLSPAFLASGDCMAELALAAQRHQRIHPVSYVQVLQIADTADLDTSEFLGYQPIDLVSVSGRKREEALSKLGSSVLRAGAGAGADPSPAPSAEDWRTFLDRKDELDRVLNGLNSAAGPHFWLVLSPPGLGKSKFLARLEARAKEQRARPWICRLVDLRASADEVVSDAMALVGALFGIDRSGNADYDLRAAAREIITASRPYLCLLDSAELLSADTVAALRRHLSQIYRLVQDRGDPQLGMTFVAASRRDDGWRGVAPYPRLSVLPLIEFGADEVQEAMSKLAAEMSLRQSPAALRRDAAIAHRATEGVPALVKRSLQWIEDEAGLQIERLDGPGVFDDIVRPFIRGQLLGQDSLLPGYTSQSETSEKRLWIMAQVIKWLVPYRFFTLAHVRPLSSDASFAPTLAEAHWSDNDLWQAIGACALLVRPQDEPWRETHPALRRLLFRYFYTEAERADAHRRAREFTEQWAAKQNGREQAIGLIDCIWHEAASLRHANAAEMGDILTNYARERAHLISESDAYTENELRTYAAERLRSDDELRSEVAGIDGLFDGLVQIVRGASGHGGVT